jgi:cell wall-associated NlpC family hydrolase
MGLGRGRTVKPWMTVLFAGMLLSGMPGAQAAPASGYSQFLASLDSILAATMPVADEQLSAARQPDRLGGQAAAVLAVAGNMLGQPVVWGGASPAQGFDCSGLVQYVYRQAGINLPRTADLQFLVGRTVSPAALQPGDLVYFTTYEPGASHVGIYIGGSKFIHTSFSQGVVAVGDLNDDYFIQRYYGAKRVI